MYIAETMALRSTCLRRRVGCVISYEGRVISTGYNGQPQPYTKTCETVCSLEDPCQIANHAEHNALELLRKTQPKTLAKEVVVYVTLSPCLECAKKLYRVGIGHLVYLEEYRDNAGILFLREKGINVTKHTYQWQFPRINS
jgi:dCMP deaminase